MSQPYESPENLKIESSGETTMPPTQGSPECFNNNIRR